MAAAHAAEDVGGSGAEPGRGGDELPLIDLSGDAEVKAQVLALTSGASLAGAHSVRC